MATKSVTNEKHQDLVQEAEKEAEIANVTGPGNETEVSRDLSMSTETARMEGRKRTDHEKVTEVHLPLRFLAGLRIQTGTDEVRVVLSLRITLAKSQGLVLKTRWRRITRTTRRRTMRTPTA